MPHVLSDTEHPMAFYKAEGPTIHRQPSETPGTLAGNYEPFPLADKGGQTLDQARRQAGMIRPPGASFGL